MKEEIKRILEELNYEPSVDQIDKINLFYQLLVEKNKVMNLTSLIEPVDFLEKHLRDSLLLYPHFKFEENSKLIDVGSGAGFPGIPIAIMHNTVKTTLLDSLTKRILFLEEVVDKLSLENVNIVNIRAEQAGQLPEFREKYDYCVSRAVSHLNKLVEYCLPFVKVGGFFIPYKGEKVFTELPESEKAIHLLGGKCIKIIEDKILEAKRVFLMIEKEKKTASTYPRSADKMAKKLL